MKLQDKEKEILNCIISSSIVSPLGFLGFAENDE